MKNIEDISCFLSGKRLEMRIFNGLMGWVRLAGQTVDSCGYGRILTSLFIAFFVMLSEVSCGKKENEDPDIMSGISDNFSWRITGEGALIISGTGELYSSDYWEEYRSSITSVVIESGITYIGNAAFSGLSGISKVSIPNSVTSIGYSVFNGCDNLLSINVDADNIVLTSDNGVMFDKAKTTLIQYPTGKQGAYTIPNTVTAIENGAFLSCSGLTSIDIPNSVTSIGYNAFTSCNNLTEVSIPNSVTSIGGAAFYDCSSLTSVIISNSVKIIEHSTFKDCINLKSVIIGSSVETILYNAFQNCVSLTEITIPNSVISIGSSAFQNCSSLTELTIPNSVTSVETDAFRGCSGLTSVAIGSSIREIARSVFGNCSGLTSITIPNTVTSIGWGAFFGCSGLTSVNIPNSVTSIGWGAFSNCTALMAINAGANNPAYTSEDGILFDIDKNTLITYPAGKSGVYTVPASVSIIAGYAFFGCSGLTEIITGNSVTNIGNSAFFGCSGLTEIITGNSVTNIENSAFGDCSGLTFVAIGNSVSTIGSGVFSGCSSLTTVKFNTDNVRTLGRYGQHGRPSSVFAESSNLTTFIIGSEVTQIPNMAFYGCNSLTEIINNATVPQPIGYNAFDFVDIANCTLRVPAASVETYKEAIGWKDFGNIVSIE